MCLLAQFQRRAFNVLELTTEALSIPVTIRILGLICILYQILIESAAVAIVAQHLIKDLLPSFCEIAVPRTNERNF